MNGFARLSFIILLLLLSASPAAAQTTGRSTLAYSSLRGRPVEQVRVMGNTQVSTPVILNSVRTRVGDRFDPGTVEEDYQRIYGLKKFANVEAKAEPTSTGVIVTFIVSEQKQIRAISFHGNTKVDTPTLKSTIDINEGEAIDAFRISIARQSIESLYKNKNFPYAHVDVDRDRLASSGELIFAIAEGPGVKIRKVDFIGNNSFSDDRLKDHVQTKSWLWIFRPGTFDPDSVEDDVSALKRFYQDKGFFDVKAAAKVTESPDQTEIKVSFLIDEGPRYIVEKVSFRGNTKLTEAKLREKLKLVEGATFDDEILQRDVREIVRAYSPFGFIYLPSQQSGPEYLHVNSRRIFRKEAGRVEIQYSIGEGKPFTLGRILIKGNGKTQDKVILREMRVAPGQRYNSAEIADATDRLRASPNFAGVAVTPIGDDESVRDLLIEVAEQPTAQFGVGAGINSNGGIGGTLTYEQRNFDIANPPDRWDDIISDRAFVGAGQDFRVSVEPGTRASNASVRFTDPWIFDQPYSFTTEAYYRDRVREHWDETRGGARVTLGKRWSYIWSTFLTLRGEDVNIHDIEDDPIRAPEIVDLNGHSTVTSASLQLRRDTVNRGLLPYKGSSASLAWESIGVLGGEFTFQKFTASYDLFIPLYEDLLDRRTILSLRGDAGWIWGTAPFFERFYAGGIGTVRGFQFRGISPRSGLDDDPVGGDFSVTGSLELSFPLAGDKLRGVIFSDIGTVEPEVELGTIRSSVGFGFRLLLPIFRGAPVALDFAWPLSKSSEDETEWFSFSLGIQP